MSDLKPATVEAAPRTQAMINWEETRRSLAFDSERGLLPKNFDECMRLADALSKSTVIPKDYQGNPGNILVAVQLGIEVGLPPLQAVQNIAVINGRPTIWGDALLGLVRASGLLADFSETFEGKPDTDSWTAVCTATRKGGEARTSRFSMGDAKRAKLTDKNSPWQTYPSRMLQMRARSWTLRDLFADVLKGLHCREEIEGTEVIRDVKASVIQMPRRKSDSAPDGNAPETDAPPHAEEAPAAPNPPASASPPKPISDAQRTRFFAICGKSGLSNDGVKGYLSQKYGLTSSKQITLDIYDSLCSWAERGGVDEPPAGNLPQDEEAEREPGSEG